ncbi:MAG: hypothetical protein AAB113_04715, partial [Candidatus Eisenbacteria bacterium]
VAGSQISSANLSNASNIAMLNETETVSGAWGFSSALTVAAPTIDSHAATKLYVDNAISGLKWKASVKAATTANGILASAFANLQVIDGVTLATGNRILIKDQTTPSENGIYLVNASGSPTRAADANSEAELIASAVFIEQGTSYADTAFVCSTNTIPTINTDPITFVQFTGAQAYVWGSGLSNSGNTVNVGAGTGITVNADTIQITPLTASRALETDGSGNLTASSVTSTELGYVSGVTQAIQTQLNSKQGTLTNSAGLAAALNDETGTGLAVFNTAPTITNPVITNINPSADFTLTQNSVVPFTSINAGAVANTLYLKAGNIGIGTTAPLNLLDVRGSMAIGTYA